MRDSVAVGRPGQKEERLLQQPNRGGHGRQLSGLERLCVSWFWRERKCAVIFGGKWRSSYWWDHRRLHYFGGKRKGFVILPGN